MGQMEQLGLQVPLDLQVPPVQMEATVAQDLQVPQDRLLALVLQLRLQDL